MAQAAGNQDAHAHTRRRKSAVAKPSMMKDMQERMPAAKLVAIRGIGHGVNMLALQKCAREIRAFIETQGEAG